MQAIIDAITALVPTPRNLADNAEKTMENLDQHVHNAITSAFDQRHVEQADRAAFLLAAINAKRTRNFDTVLPDIRAAVDFLRRAVGCDVTIEYRVSCAAQCGMVAAD